MTLESEHLAFHSLAAGTWAQHLNSLICRKWRELLELPGLFVTGLMELSSLGEIAQPDTFNKGLISREREVRMRSGEGLGEGHVGAVDGVVRKVRACIWDDML